MELSHHPGGPLVGPKALPKGSDSLIAQDISLDAPRRIGQTNLLFIGVRVRDLTSGVRERDLTSPMPASASRIFKYSEEPYSYYQNLVNVLFTRRDGSNSFPLLDKKAFIKRVDVPSEFDSLQSFLLYDISFRDTDRDGRITSKDSSQLFISDLDGENLFQVSKQGDDLIRYEKSDDCKQIFLLVRERPMKADVVPADWPERLYSFNVSSHATSIFPGNRQIIERMQNILWNK